MRQILFALAALTLSAPAVAAQDQTLADIRQELTVLSVELQKLKRELSTTGAAETAVTGDTLQRVDLIEGVIRGLTAKTETLEMRIDRIVADGTNRIGDLEFRVCEVEPGCDFGSLAATAPLGGEEEITGTTAVVGAGTVETAEFAVAEKSDFDRAVVAYENGEHDAAADQFRLFIETYPGGPLTPEAQFFLGQSLSAVGDSYQAGLAFLDSYSGAPQSAVADAALLGLGKSLGALGQMTEACTTLGEVSVRFPGSPLVSEAQAERARIGCS